MKQDMIIALIYVGTEWFMQLCLLWGVHFLVGKKSEYVLLMNIQGEQRADADVLGTVQAFKKEERRWMGIFFVTALGHLLITLLPFGTNALTLLYCTLWCTALLIMDYKVIKKYTNRMYEIKIEKGWGEPVKEGTAQVDTVVSRMKKTMPVSELWLGVPLWICIGSVLWWAQCAAKYKWILLFLGCNIITFLFLCYVFQRVAKGKLKVYSEDSEINYALNRASKRAWTGCIAFTAFLLCGYQLLTAVWVHSYVKMLSAGRPKEAQSQFFFLFIVGSVVTTAMLVYCFYRAANRVKQAKRELAAATGFSYTEDEDAYWKNGYYYNPYDPNSFVENRTLGITTNMATKWGPITKWLLLGTFFLCVGLSLSMLPFDFGKTSVLIEKSGITMKGCLYYTKHLSYEDVAEVELLEEMPESSRVWGTGTKEFALGSYHFKEYGNVYAIMDKRAPLFLMVKKTDGSRFCFSVKSENEMRKCYEILKLKTVR